MTDPDGERGAEALRRRLYRPDATDADVAAFAAATGTPPPSPAPPAVAVPSSAPGRTVRRRRRLVPAALVGAVLLGLLLVVPLARTPRPAATAALRTAAPDPAAVSDAERVDFIRRLVEGRQAGVSGWLDRHGRDLPGALAQATRSDTLEFAGDGTRTVPLAPPSVGEDGGRVTVLLVLGADGTAGWTLVRPRTDTPTRALAVGGASGPQAAGALGVATVSYPPGRRPERLVVTAPPGVRWGVAAVFTD